MNKIEKREKLTNQFDKYICKNTKIHRDVFIWFLENKEIIKEYRDFEFPSYAGMPKKLSNKLSGNFVDCIQSEWDKVQEAESMKQLCDNLLPLL